MQLPVGLLNPNPESRAEYRSRTKAGRSSARWPTVKPEGALLLTKSGGSHWGKSEQSRRIREAFKGAKIDPPISFHVLTHSYASSLVEVNRSPLSPMHSDIQTREWSGNTMRTWRRITFRSPSERICPIR